MVEPITSLSQWFHQTVVTWGYDFAHFTDEETEAGEMKGRAEDHTATWSRPRIWTQASPFPTQGTELQRLQLEEIITQP